MKNIFKNFLLLSLIFVGCITGCHHAAKKIKKSKIIIAQLKKQSMPLFFRGVLQPLHITPVIVPFEGQVVEINFHDGSLIKKGQMLVAMRSNQLAEEYQKAVMEYLQKKDNYITSQQIYHGNIILNKEGLMAKFDFSAAKSQYETAVLDYFQAETDLQKVLNKTELNEKSVEKLTLADLNALHKIFDQQFSHIVINAPVSGVALLSKSFESSANESNSERLSSEVTIGSMLKIDQRMLNIGDLNGVSVVIVVNEMEINQIVPGMKAVITGEAFDGITLSGIVTEIAAQANSTQDNNQDGSSYNIKVVIPRLTKIERRLIHIGMSVKVEMDIEKPPQIMLPIHAVVSRNNFPTVTVIDCFGTEKETVVKTGNTTETEVAILSGLKPGEKVIVHGAD
jgi:HlyD family secretion protein